MPNLPRAWSELAFSLRFRDRQVRVQLTHEEERYTLDKGGPLEISVRGEPHLLSPDAPIAIKRSRRDVPRRDADRGRAARG